MQSQNLLLVCNLWDRSPMLPSIDSDCLSSWSYLLRDIEIQKTAFGGHQISADKVYGIFWPFEKCCGRLRLIGVNFCFKVGRAARRKRRNVWVAATSTEFCWWTAPSIQKKEVRIVRFVSFVFSKLSVQPEVLVGVSEDPLC